MAKDDGTILIEGAQILFRNFEGRETPFNQKGARNFAIVLDEEQAQTLAQDGWNVKLLQPRDEDEEQVEKAFLPVALRFDVFPPKIVMITSRGRNILNEETVQLLDIVDITNLDVIIRPYEYNVNGKEGIKAYLKTMFITIEEDELEQKYAEQPTSE